MAARQIYDSEQHAQFVTFSCYKRRRLLDHERMRQLVLEILSEKLVSYYGICSEYVVMPDHVHAIVWFQDPGELSRFMKGWKQTSSLELKKLARGLIPNYVSMFVRNDPFWQPKYNPFNLYSERKAEEKLNYMHENPVRAGLVEKPVDWQASSARFYLLGESGIVPVQWIFG
jgi:putative transposase